MGFNVFFAEVTKNILSTNNNLKDTLCIVPNTRSTHELKSTFSKEQQEKPNPKIITINDFFQEISGLNEANYLEMIDLLYQSYRKKTPKKSQDNFTSYLNWCDLMLNDFNDIDINLIHIDSFFKYLKRLKEIYSWSPNIEQNKEHRYMEFWNSLSDIYFDLQDLLLQKKIAYRGLFYKIASLNVLSYLQKNTSSYFYFIGFNALTKAEEKIFQTILNHNRGDVYWDIDEYFLENQHNAAWFIRKYKNTWPYYKENTFKWSTNNFNKDKSIHIHTASKNIEQTFIVSKIVNSSTKKIGVILGDETLYESITQKLPDTNNVYFPRQSIEYSLFYTFFLKILKIKTRSKEGIYYKDLSSILNEPITQYIIDAQKISQQILKSHIQFFTLKDILKFTNQKDTKNHHLMFSFGNTQNILDDCLILIKILSKSIPKKVSYNNLETDCGIFKTLFKHLKDFFENTTSKRIEYKSLRTIYSKLVKQQSQLTSFLPNQSNIEVLNILDSRNLDFEEIIICSVNENIIPLGNHTSSFFPYYLRRTYNLPTRTDRDRIYNYHFHRLLQRSKKVHLIYNSDENNPQNSEKSRFLLMMEKFHPPNHTYHYIENVPNKTTTPKEIIIYKTEKILTQIAQIGTSGFSPSFLSNYLRNPLNFYYRYILGIQQNNLNEKQLLPNIYGSIIHDTLEALYLPYKNKFLEVKHLSKMKNEAEEKLDFYFAKHFISKNLKGNNLIKYQLSKYYVEAFLNHEIKDLKEGNSMKIIELEKEVTIDLPCPKSIPYKNLKIKGKIDRIDERNGILRIIDYKTGNVNQNELKLDALSPLAFDLDSTKILQLLCYYLLLYKHPITKKHENIQLGIISFQNLANGLIALRNKEDKKTPILNLRGLDTKRIEDGVLALIKDIFNPKIPFSETIEAYQD